MFSFHVLIDNAWVDTHEGLIGAPASVPYQVPSQAMSMPFLHWPILATVDIFFLTPCCQSLRKKAPWGRTD